MSLNTSFKSVFGIFVFSFLLAAGLTMIKYQQIRNLEFQKSPESFVVAPSKGILELASSTNRVTSTSENVTITVSAESGGGNINAIMASLIWDAADFEFVSSAGLLALPVKFIDSPLTSGSHTLINFVPSSEGAFTLSGKQAIFSLVLKPLKLYPTSTISLVTAEDRSAFIFAGSTVNALDLAQMNKTSITFLPPTCATFNYQNATVCPGTPVPATNNAPYTNVTTCGTTACTFKCNSTYVWNGTSCVLPACSSNANCNDNNACTTDTCTNPGLANAACTNTNVPVNGTWAYSAWSACSGSCGGGTGTQTRTSTTCSATCGGTCGTPVLSQSCINNTVCNTCATFNYQNATVCPGTPVPATNNAPYTNVTTCGTTACTFKCNSTYVWNGTSCVNLPGDIGGGTNGAPDGKVNAMDILKALNNWGTGAGQYGVSTILLILNNWSNN